MKARLRTHGFSCSIHSDSTPAIERFKVRVYDHPLPTQFLVGKDDCELIRAIARMVSQMVWVPLHEPRAFALYDTQEDCQGSATCRRFGEVQLQTVR